jgi:hypothetical protein
VSVQKKKRTHKISEGKHGATKHPLSPVEKVLVGKGQLQNIRHVECRFPWRGVGNVATPFDPRQVTENRRLYPHLFMED